MTGAGPAAAGGARDADAGVAALDLDLGQAGLVQELGELADEVLVDDRFFPSGVRPPRAVLLAGAVGIGASASSAST